MELLVVVTIMLILMGVVLPLARPALRGREVREAARQVGAYLASAQADAMATGRPVGVAFVPSSNAPTQSVRLVKVKVPPPFAGDSLDARVVLTGTTGMVPLNFGTSTPALNYLIGDGAAFQIKFGHRGRLYNAQRNGATYFVDLTGAGPIPATYTDPTQGTAFTIHRPPRTSMASPIELPAGAYIDLNASGFLTPDGIDVASTAPVILFSATGALHRFYGTGYTVTPPSPLPVSGPLLLPHGFQVLIASTRRQDPYSAVWPHPTAASLLPEANSLWVTTHPTGRVSTTANLGFNRGAFDPTNAAAFAGALRDARQKAAVITDLGGR